MLKLILKGLSNNITQSVSGKIKVVASLKDASKIEKGSIALIKKKSYTSDSLLITYSSITNGAVGIILEQGGRLDHGPIAARELFIPLIITSKEVKFPFKDKIYSISNAKLYDGFINDNKRNERIYSSSKIEHRLKLNLGFPETISLHPEIVNFVDGVAFCRLEFCLLEIFKNTHPNVFLKKNSSKLLTKKITEKLEIVVSAFSGKPVWFRTDDFSVDQLLDMKGGEKFESVESNPAIGFRGIRRSGQSQILKPQFKALKMLVDKGYKNIGVFPPMTTNIEEYLKWQKIAESVGLSKKNIKFGLMVETPAAALTIEKFVPHISFVVFGTNDLTQFTLALDRSNPKLQYLFDEKSPAVLYLLKLVIDVCNKNGIETTIGGQAGSDPDFLKEVLKLGITGTSVNPDLQTISKIRDCIYNYEQI